MSLLAPSFPRHNARGWIKKTGAACIGFYCFPTIFIANLGTGDRSLTSLLYLLNIFYLAALYEVRNEQRIVASNKYVRRLDRRWPMGAGRAFTIATWLEDLMSQGLIY